MNAMEIIETNKQQDVTYAGFWLRFAAYIIDMAVLSVVGMVLAVPTVISIVTIALGLKDLNDPMEILKDGNLVRVGMLLGIIILVSLISLVTSWLYYALMESSKMGGTLGKMAIGLKVTDLNGNRISFARATGRYFARIVTNLTMLIGYIMAGFTEKRQALHDILASCLVIKK